MNWKIVSAFLTGAVIASGIVFMAVKPSLAPRRVAMAALHDEPLPPPPPQRAPQKAEEPPTPVAAPESAKPAAPAAPPRQPERAPVREKPSPMPPPAPRDKPAAPVSAPPPIAAKPQPPTHDPINQERPYGDAKADEPAPTAEPAPPAPPPAPPAPAQSERAADIPSPHSVTLEAGTILTVRIGETITSKSHQPGDTFLATLERPLVIDGFIIADRGERVEGRVVQASNQANKRFAIELIRLNTSDGQHIPIHTEAYMKDNRHDVGNDVATIGAGAAIGAAIGAAAGGGKGAAIGAGVGGAAGAVLVARDRPAEIPVETRISFRVKDAVRITERLE